MCRIKSKSCFNTSHVTLYPFGHHFLFWNGLFQYISCYSLSGYSFLMRKQFPVSIHLMLLFIAKQLPDGRFSDEFQYISYYSLSITIQNQFGFQYSFNTSHVTLYRLSYRNSYQLIWVSIHLMLLFIIPALPGPERTVASFNTSLFIILARFIP